MCALIIIIAMYHRRIEIIDIHRSSSSPRYRILLLFFLHANTLAAVLFTRRTNRVKSGINTEANRYTKS